MPTEKKGKADPLRDEKDESVLQGSEDDEPAGVEEQDSLVADAENETERDQAARDAAESGSGAESQGSEYQRVSGKDEAATEAEEPEVTEKPWIRKIRLGEFEDTGKCKGCEPSSNACVVTSTSHVLYV